MKTKVLKLTNKTELTLKESNIQYVLDFSDITLARQKCELIINFPSSHVKAEILGVYYLSPNQQLNFKIVSNHIAQDTSCEILINGVLERDASSDIAGKIFVDTKALQTQATLKQQVLSLGSGNSGFFTPVLEVQTNDAKVYHGATFASVNALDLFYLCSRGLDTVTAVGLIKSSFINSILLRVQDAKIRNDLKWLPE